MRMPVSEYNWPSEYEAPFDAQVQTTIFMLKYKRAFILNEMGTGKTLSALWACDILMINDLIKKVLICAPLSTVHSVWGLHIFKYFPNRSYSVLTGSRDKRLKLMSQNNDFDIINPDGIKTIEKELIANKYDAFIVDEITAFKTLNTDRSKAARRVAKSIKAVWGMSGNPTPNAPTESFAQAKLVNPTNPKLPVYFSRFRDEVMYKLDMYTWVPKPGAENRVAEILSPGIRFERKDCIDIPECMHQTLELEMGKDQSKVYKELYDEYLYEYEQGEITASNAAVRMIKLLQVSAGVVYDDERKYYEVGCQPKLDAISDIWAQLPNRKLIVFVSFTGCIPLLEKFFDKKKIKHGSIFGGTSEKKRPQLIHDFQEGDLEVLIIQAQTVSHGVTLTSSSTIVWFSPNTSGETYQQANARITRPGQKYKQMIYKLCCSKVEKYVYKALDRKEKLGDALLELFV